MQNPHIVRRDTNPVGAPPETGIHWINEITGTEFFSVGTASVADWSSGGGGGGGGSGDVIGPASAVDNAVARFDLATGKIIQSSTVIIDDSGNLTVTGTVDGRGIAIDGNKLDGIEALADVTKEANVLSSLDGANITAVTVIGTDKVLLQDVSDSNNLKTATAQDIADLSAGTTLFTGLTDTPASYTGAGLQSLRVNTLATALEFYTPSVGAAQSLVDVATQSTTALLSKFVMQADVEFETSTGNVALFLDDPEGVVGIGTSAPLSGDNGTNLLDIGGSSQVNSAIDPIVCITGNNSISAMQLQNTSPNGEMRFIAATSTGEYQAFTTPGNNATGNFGGVLKKNSVFWFASSNGGSDKEMTMVNLGAEKLNFGTDADIQMVLHGNGGFTFGNGLTGTSPGLNKSRFEDDVLVDTQIGIGNTAPTSPLDISGDSLRIRAENTPSSATATGNKGTIVWDTNFIYVCTATNTWKRTAIATW
jgi:hypothetical protein